MQRFYSALFAGLTGLCFGGASAPISPTPAYPQNPAISDAQGRPRDTTTFYFPAALSCVDQLTDKMQYSQTAYCQMALASASANLFFFKAPVLSNYYLGNDTYRFLWLRSFHRPVLLTLTQQAGGATLRTQFLTKSATAPRLEQILFVPPTASQAEAARLQ
ncbi:hypothetical protein [Hymenobacter glacieicola]|uniref:Uncharacterized protein n=1 Tax=Hymenobacter glacieicola TaxID=1562124 RepID=A0ABQ1X105_9BACT|nr:hypothetical protein [Hymenobacter glacieicola]GGG50702.1 hypothetical protein GCM10011378_28570 [Hymenobacter glacieicola]